MEGMFKGTGLTAPDLYLNPQTPLTNKMGNSGELDIHKAYSWS